MEVTMDCNGSVEKQQCTTCGPRNTEDLILMISSRLTDKADAMPKLHLSILIND